MRTGKKKWRGVCLDVVGAALILLASATASPRASGTSLGVSAARIRVPDVATEWPLRQAIDGAHEWLGDEDCQAVFSDFNDLAGKLLSETLAEGAQTGQDHLARLIFADGSAARECRVPGVAFFTAPGCRVIFVCPVEFRRLARTPRRARATVIHELLHSLGLGENPPSSREITARVLERCGR